MSHLWAPWRMAYVGGTKSPGCIFCAARDTADLRRHHVLAQTPAVVMLNRFPYTSGHIMVAPRAHCADPTALPVAEFDALMHTLQRAVALVRDTFQPDGLNVGMNLGAAAGAGVIDHLHWHVVPRWVGDTNFMPTLADVHVVPEHLDTTFDRLAAMAARLTAA
jgi:ATP adenylyltransferase